MSMMTISDAARRSGVSAKTIRYYESIGLIRPASRHGNNYRAYRDQDVEFLRFIQRARSLGFSLKEVDALIALYTNRRRRSREVKRLCAWAHRRAQPQDCGTRGNPKCSSRAGAKVPRRWQAGMSDSWRTWFRNETPYLILTRLPTN